MHMTELTTPYEKRKVIEYGSGRNFNTPVRHWHEVQQVAGPLYKSREVENRYGEQECDLYLFYDGIPAGLRFMRQKRIEDRDTPEYLLGLVQTGGLVTLYMQEVKKGDALSYHYQLVDAYVKSVLNERQFGAKTDADGKKRRETAHQSLEKVVESGRKQFSSFSPSKPEQYSQAVSKYINALLPVWMQYRDTYINLQEVFQNGKQ